MLKNILYFISSLAVFTAGIIIYGIILNVSEPTLEESLREKGLSIISDIRIEVDRKNYSLALYSNNILVKKYKAVFGRNNSSRKRFKNDFATPVGQYFICSIDTNSRYKKFFRISYPNHKDAAEALYMGFLTKNDYDIIIDKLENYSCPEIKKRDVPVIGIHGIGKLNFIFKNLPFVYNWTNGSVAVCDENIDEIYSVIKIGTEVVIKN